VDDLSALIFVALAVAWAVYLIPRALQHHEDAVRSRSVDRFSHTMRVLARREPVNRRNARLVVSPGRTPSAPIVTTKHVTTPIQDQASPAPTRAAALPTNRGATRRRRRVLGLILVSLLATIGAAAFGVISWWYVAIPGAVLVSWLVACRLMVRHEQTRDLDAWLHEAATGELPAIKGGPPSVDEFPTDPVDPMDDTTSTPAITDPSLWDPMPVTLPTYVGKPAAQARSVRTIDLDSTGVWTSGRTDADAVIARQADDDERARKAAQVEQQRRASGS
jgi:hypothetical protein